MADECRYSCSYIYRILDRPIRCLELANFDYLCDNFLESAPVVIIELQNIHPKTFKICKCNHTLLQSRTLIPARRPGQADRNFGLCRALLQSKLIFHAKPFWSLNLCKPCDLSNFSAATNFSTYSLITNNRFWACGRFFNFVGLTAKRRKFLKRASMIAM